MGKRGMKNGAKKKGSRSGWVKPTSYRWHILALRLSEPHLGYNAIAERVGCSVYTVIGDCHRLGMRIPYSRPPHPNARKVAALRAQGKTFAEITASTGVIRGDIRRILRSEHARHA
jgi:hypothetical protein